MPRNRADPIFDPYYWRKIITALLLNALSGSIIVGSSFCFGIIDQELKEIIKTFQNNYPLFFAPWSDFFKFLNAHVLRAAIFEELIYRAPIRIMVACLLIFTKKPRWLPTSMVWLLGLSLNFHWAMRHSSHELMWIPVFVSGLVWLWLVIRTNQLWPSIICHSVANLTIYFLIKIYQLT